jgi:hypothetical protein
MSEQTETDLQHLVALYSSTYRYHQYMIEHRPRVWHPWETLWDVHSWIKPLSEVRAHMREAQWSVPFKVPRQVRQSYDYHPDVYEPCIYLLECYANLTRSDETTDVECPPAPQVWSVEHAAIWVQAHQDLIEMRTVLRDRHVEWLVFAMDAELPLLWLDSAQKQLNDLWDDNHQTFLSKEQGNTTESVVSSGCD